MNLAATDTELVESYALRLDDPVARELVGRWYGATLALRAFIEARRDEALDLGDVSTLAEMFVCAAKPEFGIEPR